MSSKMPIDVHSHCIPQNMVDFIKKEGNPYQAQISKNPAGQEMVTMGESVFPLSPMAYNPPSKLGWMDERGVGSSVLSLSPRLFGYWLNPQDAVHVAKLANDGVAEYVSYSPQRLRGMATVPLNSVDESVKELQRSVQELGFKAVQIGAHMEEKTFDNPEFLPFFEAAQALDVLILVHPYSRSPQQYMEKYYLQNLIGMLVDTSLCIASLIFGGVMDRYPNLKFCFSHGGGFIPYQYGRLDRGFQVRKEVKGTCNEPPSSYLKRFYYDTITHDSHALQYLIEKVGSERILLGSDHPFDMGDANPVNTVMGIGTLKETDRDRILFGTAAEMFGF